MAMNFAEYLLPGVSSEYQLLFVICLIVVATLDICTKHCVARLLKNKKQRRCGKDIDPVVTLTAISELKKSVSRLSVDPLSNADVSPVSAAIQEGNVRF